MSEPHSFGEQEIARLNVALIAMTEAYDNAMVALRETSDFRDTLIAVRHDLIAERDALRAGLASILDRVRPDVEAAPWVVEELRALVSDRAPRAR